MVRGKTAFTATWLAVLIVGIVTYFELRDQPFFYDANSYVLAAHGIAEKGLLNNWYHAELRTYGFPVFLIGAFKVAQWLHISPTSGIFAMQWPMFVGSAWLASTSLFRSDRTRLIAFAAIAANPLLVVYVAQALTESLSLTCVLLAVAALGRAARAGRPTVRAAWLVTGATASSFAMEVRPGNLLIPVFFTLAAAGVLRWTNVKCRWPANVATAMVVSAALLVPLVPQVLVNHHNYQRLTPFPVFDLAGLQASEGVSLIRYASNVSPDCGEAALRFLNPAKPVVVSGMSTSMALRYYTLSWPEGPETAALHVFSGLDPRPFLTYQHDFGARYERGLQALTLALLLVGCAGALKAFPRVQNAGWKSRMDAVFLGAVTVGAVGILATSAAEYRFGALPLLSVSLLAAVALSGLRRPTRRAGVVIAGYLGALLVWFALSDLVLATSGIWQRCV